MLVLHRTTALAVPRGLRGRSASTANGWLTRCRSTVQTDSNGVTTGEIEVRVQAPVDKANEVRRARDAYRSDRAALPDGLVVFIGGGVNDLLALLEADIDIAISSDSSTPGQPAALEEAAQHYGISIKPIERLNSLVEYAEAANLVKPGQSRIIFSMERHHTRCW